MYARTPCATESNTATIHFWANTALAQKAAVRLYKLGNTAQSGFAQKVDWQCAFSDRRRFCPISESSRRCFWWYGLCGHMQGASQRTAPSVRMGARDERYDTPAQGLDACRTVAVGVVVLCAPAQ